MRALQAIGMGLVLVVLRAPAADPGLDLFPDPLGWLLVALGVRRLPVPVERRPLLLALAGLALVVSVVLWVPATAERALALEESLRWLLDLPTPVFVLVLARSLAAAAAAAGDDPAQGWWRLVVVGAVLTVLLPTAVHGADADVLATPAVTIAVGTLLAALVLCFTHSARPWAHGATDPAGRAAGPPLR